MPSGREYSMRFVLESMLGSNFKGSFTQAQKQLQLTQSQMQALQREQANISAYQKQQEAVDKTSQKLADLQKQYDNIQREISETEGYSSSLENKLLTKQRAIESTSASLHKQTDRLKQYESALQESGIDTKNIGAESERLTSKLEGLRKEQAKLNAETQNYGKVGTSSFTAVGEILIASGISKGLNEIKETYDECVSLAADFQSTMSTVEALSGARSEDMAQLSALAKKLGATTKFTATESAQAMTYMAMAGWDASNMISGMDGVMQLAAASGEDLAMVSDIVTDNLTAFGMKASDTARFSDVLAAAATNSNTSVSIMGETFKNCAALAGALGYSVEDVAVAVGLMANAGIKGSNAGTALKNVFNGLLEGITLTSDAFGKVEYSAINADGTVKSFGETLDELRYYFNQMTGAEQLQNSAAIAGQRAMSGFISILNASEEDIQKLSNSINNSTGAAKRMADIKLNNLTGQMTLLNSAADALKTTVGEAYQNEFQSLAKIGADILSEVNEFLVAHPQLLRFFIALTAEVGALVAIYTTYKLIKSGMNVVKALSAALTAKETAATIANTAATTAEAAATGTATTAQIGLNAAMAANPIGLVITGIAALTVSIAALVSTTKKEEEETERVTFSTKKQREELSELTNEYERACSVYGKTSWQAQELKLKVDELSATYAEKAQTTSEFLSGIQEDIDAYNSMVESHKSAIDEINTEEASVMSLVGRLEQLTENSVTAKESQAEIVSIIRLLNEELPDLGLHYDSVSHSLSMTTESLEEYAKAQYKAQKNQQNFVALGEKSALQDSLEASLKAVEAEKEAAKVARDEAQKQLDENEAIYHNRIIRSRALKDYDSSVKAYADAIKQNKKDISDADALIVQYNSDIESLNKQISENQDEISRLNSELEDYIGTIDDANSVTEQLSEEGLAKLNKALQLVQSGDLDVDAATKMFGVDPDILQKSSDAISAYRDNLESAITAVKNGWLNVNEAAAIYGVTVEDIERASEIDDTIESLDRLAENYSKVYQAAYQSINGQYDLWDKAVVVVPKSIEDINTALETQMSYWSDYNTDLANLLDRDDDIDGLREIIATFADGSKDSVNAIAGMAAASDDELREMVKISQEVQGYKQETSDTLSEIVTGTAEQYSEMKNELESKVMDLNLSDEAAEAAEMTVEAYVEAIRSGTDAAVEEAHRLSSLVAMALYGAPGIVASQHKYTSSAGVGLRGRVSFSAYAGGTNGAAPGAAIVGENGPEIVVFEGGERIYNAKETQMLLQESKNMQALRSSDVSGLLSLAQNNIETAVRAESVAPDYIPDSAQQIVITISPTFNIEGSEEANNNIAEHLRDICDELKGEILDAIEEAGIDAKRRIYV